MSIFLAWGWIVSKQKSRKRKHWRVTFYDEGQSFGPYLISMDRPINDVEAAVYAMRMRPKGFTLNVKFVAEKAKPRPGFRGITLENTNG